jgi:hypothetical protein
MDTGAAARASSPAGESPIVSVARVGYVAMPQLAAGNQPRGAMEIRCEG